MKESTEILTKQHNFRLWQSGAFGNKLRAWRSIDEWRASGFTGKVVLRMSMGRGGPCYYDLTPEQVDEALADRRMRSTPRDWIMVNEASPKEAATLQGEYHSDVFATDDWTVWAYFLYSREPLHMREALNAHSEIAYNLRTDLMLKLAMTPSSYEDWRVLLERYPAHVFEVSIFSRCVGDTPGRNALVWEVRKY